MSLRFVLFDLSLFSPEDDPSESRKDLGWLLEALVQRDQAYLKAHPNTPLLYQSGVTYERPAQFQGYCKEASVLRSALGASAALPAVAEALDTVQSALGGERFRDIGRILENGSGDCDNVASWRVAELRQNGIQASPYITWRRRLDGGMTYHVLVRWPDNTLEDPSLLLGMGGEARAADRQEEIRKNAERVQMVKDSLAKKRNANGNLPSTVMGGAPPHHHHNHAHNPVLIPTDEWGIVDLDREDNESFDEALLRRTGLLRGR